MSREVVLASEEEHSFEEDTKADIKLEVGVDESDNVAVKSESDAKANSSSDKKTIHAQSESNSNPESGNIIPYADDEEDVPSDFFDDFSNQDFMAGLDIVDAWDEEEFADDKDKAKKINESRELRQKNRRKRPEKEKAKRHSPIRYNDRNDRRRRSRDRSHSPRDRDRRRRSKDKKSRDKLKDKEPKEAGNDEQAADHRRDPEKTKRDIQKDKDKCAKNKEAKIISEKLKVVETGLVPPGMEMEVDLKQLKSAMPVIKEQDKKVATVREERGVRDEKRSTREERREEKTSIREEKLSYERRKRSRSISVEVIRSRYMIREKRYSPPRRVSRSPRSRDRSIERRVRPRSRSPYRGRSRSPYFRDRERQRELRRLSSERRLYIEERRKLRRYRDSSPTVLRRKSRDRSLDLSPISNLSEREMWLRQREREQHKRDRKISCSPVSDTESVNRKRSHDFLEELANKLKSDKKKKSFLKEIQDRLNEPSQLEPNYSRLSAPGPVPAPMAGVNSAPGMSGQMHGHHAVPGPGFMPGPSHQFFPQSDPAPQYDQQFFIGQPDVFRNPNQYAPPFMGPGPVPNLVGSVPLVPPASNTLIVPHPISSPLNHPNFNGNMQNNVDLLKAQKAAESQKEKDQEAITKLFEDKKISLSDFLSMSAKHADPSKPVNVQKKIRVISLCQDAIKSLGGDSKLSGRFFLKKRFKDTEKKDDFKFQSPLRKIPVVRFRFTTPTKGSGEDRSSLQTTLNKLLASLGITEASSPATLKPSLSPVSSEASVKSIPLKKTAPVNTPPPRKYDPILGAKYQMKMCQTDPVKCNICEIRKARKFVDQGTQCVITTTSSGTQITDEDMQRFGIKLPMKDALRNQSFAHLTPAQILAAQPTGQEESPKKDIFPAARMMTPPPPDISPEKKNIRANLSNNDSFPNRSDYLDRYKPQTQSNNTSRPGGFKPPSIFKLMSHPFENANRPHNPFDNMSRPNSFENVNKARPNFDVRSSITQQIQQHNENNRFRGNPGFNQRMVDDELDFEPPNNYGGNTNQRSFIPPARGNYTPGPYGRNFF